MKLNFNFLSQLDQHMPHIFMYLDESGCLGFNSPGATQYFVITLLKIEGENVQKEAEF